MSDLRFVVLLALGLFLAGLLFPLIPFATSADANEIREQPRFGPAAIAGQGADSRDGGPPLEISLAPPVPLMDWKGRLLVALESTDTRAREFGDRMKADDETLPFHFLIDDAGIRPSSRWLRQQRVPTLETKGAERFVVIVVIGYRESERAALEDLIAAEPVGAKKRMVVGPAALLETSR